MGFSELLLNEDGEPHLNQPVPLRLVPLITGWSVKMLLELLGSGYEVPGKQIFPLDALVYDRTAIPKETHRSTYKDLRKSFPLSCDKQTCISVLPENHFVWSEDLDTAFTRVIDDTSSRDEALAAGIRLIWAPDVSTIQPVLDKCPNFEKLLSATSRNMTKTQLKYQEWCKRRQELIDSGSNKYRKGDGNINEREIAKTIGGEADVTHDHIRKMIRRYCK